ncbi:unnamed protein product [Ambrosiozyma monospora]|uniref:Unnamed protein product n=1 Tax=Ambrosiozyma monospora TaxID=43982 RepID=A0ACB5SUV9_AMBMO|nr:unnamed protein product [Ambrosiozyma monospora]
MSLSFLPGEPNRSPQCSAFVNWNLVQIIAYCSGNNLVILTKNSQHLQTLYLDEDSFVIDINRVNGKIAIAMKNRVLIYTPTVTNFYNFNFNGRKNISDLHIHWSLETEITNKRDDSKINCICWSDSCEIRDDELDSNQFFGLPDEYNSETSCELAVGSDKALTLFRFYYKSVDGEKKIHKKTLWFKPQPNPVYLVHFSPNSTAIASVGYYDKLVKVWHRVSFGIESSEFQLSYLPHPTYVTSLRWRSLPKIAKTELFRRRKFDFNCRQF